MVSNAAREKVCFQAEWALGGNPRNNRRLRSWKYEKNIGSMRYTGPKNYKTKKAMSKFELCFNVRIPSDGLYRVNITGQRNLGNRRKGINCHGVKARALRRCKRRYGRFRS